ncbi:hypothetical protein QEH59_18070, partial [Coraliomargarita sp. SDUM461004]
LAQSQDKKRIQRTSSNYGLRKGTLNYAMALRLVTPADPQKPSQRGRDQSRPYNLHKLQAC